MREGPHGQAWHANLPVLTRLCQMRWHWVDSVGIALWYDIEKTIPGRYDDADKDRCIMGRESYSLRAEKSPYLSPYTP